MFDKIKCAIFDMDGTLIDSLMLWDLLWAELGKRFRDGAEFRISAESDRAIRTMLLFDAMDYIHKEYNIGGSGEELFNIANNLFKNFYENEVQLKKGVLKLLEMLKSKGIRIFIASASGGALVKAAIKHCGIEDYIEKIFSCAEVGKGKEEPDVYLAAASYCGASVSESCVFEDSVVAVKTSHDAGFFTIGIYDKYGFGQDEIKKLSDIYIAEGESYEKLI